MIEVGKTRTERLVIGVALLAIAASVVLIKVLRGDGFAVIDGLLIAGFGIGGYALIDPALAKDLMDRGRKFVRKNGNGS